MRQNEYIRSRSEGSQFALLSIPVDRDSARFTFLHAGRSTWPEADEGQTAAAERGHSHPVYHAILYTSGRNTMIHDGIPQEFVRGTLVLTDPGCVHEYRPRDAGGGAFIELTFDLRRADSSPLTLKWADLIAAWFGSTTSWQNTPVTIPPPHLERITGYMDDVVSALTVSDQYNEPAAALAMGRFILELCRYFDGENYARDENRGDRIEQARILLEQRFASEIGISDLAEVACLSEGAFIRSFSARYGVPPMTYRKRLRITAAQHLLSVSGRPIGEIATNVGYSDIYTFSRTFKAVIGCTASEWRNRTGE